MKIRFDDIPERGLELSLSGEEDILSHALETLSTPEGVRIDPMVRGLVTLSHQGLQEILVTAHVKSCVHLRCSRCLADFDLTGALDVHLVLRLIGAELLSQEELAQSDPNEVLIHGDEIDLGEIIAQEFLLELPMKPLCNEQCPGLCPHCGALRGSEQCKCLETERIDSRWATIAVLKEKIST
jgi:uncharacterized protein